MTLISREKIQIAYQEGIEAVIDLIEKSYQELLERIEELENQKAKNSKNSDKPPSGDGFGKQTKSLYQIPKKTRQIGHQG